MRIALLADAASIHTVRWVRALAARGITVELWSDRPATEVLKVPVHPLPVAVRGQLNVPNLVYRLRRELHRYAPDLVHAHYVSRYGLYGALVGHRPLVLSVWGADVEVFPHARPWLNGRVLRAIFGQAAAVSASSHYLARVTGQFTSCPIEVIPFGINRQQFGPQPDGRGPLKWIVNKALESVYGLDFLIEAWARVGLAKEWYGRILGEGRDRAILGQRIVQLGLESRITLEGRVSSDLLPKTLAWADVGLYPSQRESFGVAPLEMMAVGRSVIANRVGGLEEVVAPEVTGWLVTPNQMDEWVRVLTQAVEAPERLREMGRNGPKWVADRYDFAHNVEQMVALYHKILSQAKTLRNQGGVK